MNFGTSLRKIALIFALLVPIPAISFAQTTNTILVLDASGSMWGQIGGEAKITIAKRVINELLDTLPDDQHLGLSAYGHREKGACDDIELLVAPAAGTRDAIRAAISRITPLGKTPLTASVRAAAEVLKYEEDAATVILISDGRETCDLDPCAVGADLEANGINFTAHVVGFDIDAPEDKAQLACLAEATGGRFLSASNADELRDALKVVAEAPPAPALGDLLVQALDGAGGPVIGGGLIWTLTPQEAGGTSLENFEINALRVAALPGKYLVQVDRPDDGARAQNEIEVIAGQDNHFVLTLISATPDASLSAPASAAAGSDLLVGWTGPTGPRDFISVAEPGNPSGVYKNYTDTSDGMPAKLLMPAVPGTYELRYVQTGTDKVLARQPIEVTPISATLQAADVAEIGSLLRVTWTGPDYPRDFISVAEIDGTPGSYVNYVYTRDGAPADLRMPSEPGEYELRYSIGQDNTTLASRPISVTPAQVALKLVQTALAGADIMVAWRGPDAASDYISVAEPGSSGSSYISYTYTSDGAPARLQMPAKPGDYEVRYILGQDNTVLASQAISITPVTGTLSAPAAAPAGARIAVQWTGPDYRNDHISVAEPGSSGSSYINYAYTRDGAPADLEMPAKPGSYEIRYIIDQDKVILARHSVEVTPVEAMLTAPGTAPAGASIPVQWSGPDYQGDYVAIAEAGSDDSAYSTYSNTRDGATLDVETPDKPGAYELRYVMRQGNTVIFRQPLTIE